MPEQIKQYDVVVLLDHPVYTTDRVIKFIVLRTAQLKNKMIATVSNSSLGHVFNWPCEKMKIYSGG